MTDRAGAGCKVCLLHACASALTSGAGGVDSTGSGGQGLTRIKLVLDVLEEKLCSGGEDHKGVILVPSKKRSQ